MFSRLKSKWLKPAHEPMEDQTFVNIMTMASVIAAESPQGLRELVRALLRPLQAENMIAVASNSDIQVPGKLSYLDFFFPLQEIATSTEFYLRDKPQILVELARDIVLATPWKRPDYANALATIGSGKSQGAWCQDDSNHFISLVFPWRIGFVGGGNHSITAGILMGEGEVFAGQVLDMSPLLQRVRCDGNTYREIGTDRVLGAVLDPRRAAVFEIGRLMVAAGFTNR